MEVKTITNPDRAITLRVAYFQFRFMGWDPEDIDELDDRYGSLPFGYCIAYENDQIVGVGNILKRSIEYKGKSILLGGLGGGCTHEEYRERGVSTAVTQARLECLKQEGCDVAFLCTSEHLIDHYTKLGFTPLNTKYKATGISGKVYLGEGGMIAPVCSQKVFEERMDSKEVFDLQGQDW